VIEYGPIQGHPAGSSLIARRLFTDGRETCVIPLTFGRARITLGRAGSCIIDDGW